jgi:hypothetical protein
MQINTTSVRRVMGLAALVAAVAGTSIANAQQNDDNVRGSFDQPLKASKAPKAAQSGRSTMTIKESDGEHSYSVKIEGDKVTAELDGEELPSNRVRQRDGRVQILDEDGDVMKTFDTKVVTQPFAAAAPRFRFEAVPGDQPQGLGGTTRMWTSEPTEPPKVMIGIMMNDSEEGGAKIESVMPGLPAEKAGVQVGDRVIKCNGKDIEDVEGWRGIIRDANPGDTMNITVDRDGKNVDLKIKLAKFDPEKMPKREAMPEVYSKLMHGMGDESLQAARESIQKAIETLKDTNRLEGKALETVRDALQKALDQLEEVKAHSALRMDDMNRVFGAQGQNFVFPAPPAPAASGDLARQLEKMNAQMEKLNRRLDELEKNKR